VRRCVSNPKELLTYRTSSSVIILNTPSSLSVRCNEIGKLFHSRESATAKLDRSPNRVRVFGTRPMQVSISATAKRVGCGGVWN